MENSRNIRASLRAGVLLGVGVMAAMDEIIFHQLLAWHHFYDGATRSIGLFADGILHAVELLLLVSGFFLILDLQRAKLLYPKIAVAGALGGAGAFQVFDGLINHKLLRLHQIRYVPNLLPYDLVWNIFGVLLVITGIIIYRRFRRATT